MRPWRRWPVLLALTVLVLTSFVTVCPARAIYLDENRSIMLSGVFYNQVRYRTTDSRRYAPHASDWTMLQHRYFLGGGSYDWYWLLRPDGKEVGPVGETTENFEATYSNE